MVALRQDGVQLKIVTGDNELVTRHVCEQVGVDASGVVLGDEIERMTDTALQHVVEETTVFARVSPAQKNRIILALKHRSHVVGYMGDGINDAPSLHAADVGISVEGALMSHAMQPTSSWSSQDWACFTREFSKGEKHRATF